MVNWKRRRKGALSWGRVESRLLKWQRRQIGEPAAEKRQLTQRRQEARAPGAGRWGGKDGLELLTPRVKAPSSRNPCVLASLRCLAPICSQAAKVLVDELPREAFGVRPACWRCRMAVVIRKREQAPRTPNASRNSGASLHLCAFALVQVRFSGLQG